MDRSTAFNIIYAVDEQGKPVPCDVVYCTLSTSRNTGGDIRTLKGVVPTGSRVDLQRSRMINLVPKADKGQRRGTEHHVHLCLLMAVNGQYINGGPAR
jgi:hypothetical protein